MVYLPKQDDQNVLYKSVLHWTANSVKIISYTHGV